MPDQQIKEKDMVSLVSDPNTTGMVFSIEKVGDTVKYEVFVNGELRTFYAGQIKPKEKAAYQWADIGTFQCYLTAYEINNPSASNLYSLNAARVDFVPYQFRPALKLIKADEPRILIADSVGVGKTIEAGLIIKELEARGDLYNVVVICPKPLVSERKWELEMKRFDEDFIPIDGATLRQIISDTDRDGAWPVRYGKIIVPYSIMDSKSYGGNKKNFGLKDLDPAPHFDLVIVDEAHHIRNGSEHKDKAYAYKCTKYFCDHADAVVMLTATPLQNGDDDLFTLLNVLRPDLVIDKETFSLMAEPNRYVSRAAVLARGGSEGWQVEANNALNDITQTRWGEKVIAKNPLYRKAHNVLSQKEITREERVQLISDIEALHSFDNMINRTRRKDIQDFCIRRPYTSKTKFTPEQAALYEALLKFEYEALSTMHDSRNIPFMMSMLKRQAASSIYGLAGNIRDIIERRIYDNDEECKLNPKALDKLTPLAVDLLALADSLPDFDPKIEELKEIIAQKQQERNNKIILFSTFKHTLAYIRKKLASFDIRLAQIDGSVADVDRSMLHDRFALPKEDEKAIDMLLFTEVGTEGLDYQFCNLMINYDLPWNPMQIEQRIGRIDRRGQTSEFVNIYNLITEGTIDADIYDRCMMRIGVFQRSIGDCDEILGSMDQGIQDIAMNAKLTAEERRYKLSQIADNEIRQQQELARLEEEQKSLFGFNLSNYTMTEEIQKAESPWLKPQKIKTLVESYLNDRLGKSNRITGESDAPNMKIGKDAKKKLKEDFMRLSEGKTELNRQWDAYLKDNNPDHKITFLAETANKERKAFFLTPMHPLVKQAARFYSTTKTIYVNLEVSSDKLPSGDYPFIVYAWNYIGLSRQVKLVPICKSADVCAEFMELLQQAVSVDIDEEISADMWHGLDDIHVTKWQEAQKEQKEAVARNADYKLETLEHNYRRKKRNLEDRIASNIGLVEAQRGELAKALEDYNAKVSEVERRKAKADIHTKEIARGILHIVDK